MIIFLYFDPVPFTLIVKYKHPTITLVVLKLALKRFAGLNITQFGNFPICYPKLLIKLNEEKQVVDKAMEYLNLQMK